MHGYCLYGTPFPKLSTHIALWNPAQSHSNGLACNADPSWAHEYQNSGKNVHRQSNERPRKEWEFYIDLSCHPFCKSVRMRTTAEGFGRENFKWRGSEVLLFGQAGFRNFVKGVGIANCPFSVLKGPEKTPWRHEEAWSGSRYEGKNKSGMSEEEDLGEMSYREVQHKLKALGLPAKGYAYFRYAWPASCLTTDVIFLHLLGNGLSLTPVCQEMHSQAIQQILLQDDEMSADMEVYVLELGQGNSTLLVSCIC